MIKNEVGENSILGSTTQLQTSENHNFGVNTDTSSKICTRVEQILRYKSGLLLNIDVPGPF